VEIRCYRNVYVQIKVKPLATRVATAADRIENINAVWAHSERATSVQNLVVSIKSKDFTAMPLETGFESAKRIGLDQIERFHGDAA
jgi:hypothetical protein